MTLKKLLPQIETDWLMPVWLLLAIILAAVAEIAVIGSGVQEIYGVWFGWIIGAVVASVQALGSQMYSRAVTHNARRKTYKSSRGDGTTDETKSEPKLNAITPIFISCSAGAISFVVASALYVELGQAGIVSFALAFASPAGSVAAAVLNGLFVSGESAVESWRTEREKAQSPIVHRETKVRPPKDYKEYVEMCRSRNGQGPISAQKLMELGVPKSSAYKWFSQYIGEKNEQES
jgi:hypothetical protein